MTAANKLMMPWRFMKLQVHFYSTLHLIKPFSSPNTSQELTLTNIMSNNQFVQLTSKTTQWMELMHSRINAAL